MVKEYTLLYYSSIAGRRIIGFMPFPKSISVMWKAISFFSGFELMPSSPYPIMITIKSRGSSNCLYIYIYIYKMRYTLGILKSFAIFIFVSFQKLQELEGIELIPHPVYSLDLAPWDNYLFWFMVPFTSTTKMRWKLPWRGSLFQ